ncbi:MAG: discoidin domain-containing protein [bacterium]|nr:discoidin domain-containing protein [bacterium]
MFRIIVAVLFLLSTFRIFAATEENIVRAIKTHKPPVIDGDLEELWKNAAKIDTFVTLKGKPISKQWTTVYLLYDDNALYIAFECRHPDISKMKTTCTKRDQEICLDDSVEIFIDPGRTKSDYYHFMINSNGVYYDAFGYRAGSVYNAEWNAEFPLKTKIDKNAWYLEMALPYAIFDITPETGSIWGINFCRNMPGFADSLSQAFPTIDGFHIPEKFGVILGLNVDFSKYCYTVEDLKAEGFLTADGQQVVQVKGKIHNMSGKKQENNLTINIFSTTTGKTYQEKKKIFMEPGKAMYFSIPFTGAAPDRYQVCVQIKNQTDEPLKIFWKTISSQSTVSNLILKYPSYRNAFYATMKDKVLRAILNINCDESLLKKLKYSYAVIDKDEKKLLEKEKLSPMRTSGNSIAFDTKNFPYGQYTLNVSLFLEGKKIDENHISFFRYPASPSEVRIAEDGVLVVNGKRFFPIGLHGVNPWTAKTGDLDAIASAGFNTISDTSSDETWLKELSKRNLKLFCYDFNVWEPWCIKEKEKYLEDGLKTVERLKNSPVLLAYFFGDEPEIHPNWSLEGLIKGYQKMKKIDPYHPVTPVVTSPGAYYQEIFRSFNDILGINPYLYPNYDNPDLNSRRLMGVIEKVKAAVEIGGTKQPVWVDPQIFDMRAWEQRFHPGEIFPGRMPYLKEQRYTVYRSIIEGAKGFLFWSWFHDYANPNLNPAAWEMLRALAGEMNYLHDILVSEEKPDTVVSVNNEKISTKILKHLNNVFIIAANDSPQKSTARFSLKGKNIKILNVVSENRSLTLQKNCFTDTFEPFGVHIYTDRDISKGTLIMEKMLKDPLFASEPKKDKNPKNLCWEGNGAKISSSWTYHSFKDSPVFAIDGDIRTCWFTRRWGPNAGPVREDDEIWIKRLKETWKNDWLQIDFPEEVTIGRIEMISWLPRYYPDPVNVLSDYEIQYQQGKNWTTLLKNTGNKKEKVVHTFPQIKTSSIRLIVTKGLYVAEIQAYEK